ncbi:DNA methyltransferase [Jiangella asiatica]|uniref:Methyltransferase n=1 Tax=Jiangella asiatica TaxID=2530372 RepID=A0A4R5DEI9_9ACTN|nr:DNA methyltransferase [Jiangella asiatica]TDE10154.1 site-specific DNA-methyltransferase [Jiangella asiatica]
MRPWLQQWSDDLEGERFADADEDVHFTQNLAETVIAEYSLPGQLVLDPFAGFGTTLVVAERMGRRGLGLELLPDRAELVRRRLDGHGELITGDARQVARLVDRPVDLCLTSPPYMSRADHPENPLNGYLTLDGDYSTYLAELGDIFGQVTKLLRPRGHLVVNVGNMVDDGVPTLLAWDVGRLLAEHLTFRQEVFLCWDSQPEWLTGDYCLVFQRTDDSPRP